MTDRNIHWKRDKEKLQDKEWRKWLLPVSTWNSTMRIKLVCLCVTSEVHLNWCGVTADKGKEGRE